MQRFGRWGLTLLVIVWVGVLLFGAPFTLLLVLWWPIAGNLPFWQSANRDKPSRYGRGE